MPACLTHYYFAKNILESLPNRQEMDTCAYFWGAQGPDFLFCHRFFPWMKGESLKVYGSMLHEKVKPSVTFSAMRDFLRKHSDSAYRSYVMGFLCHYSLDSIAHPYINSLADRLVCERANETRTTMHGEIEGALDTIVLRYETGKLPSEISLGKMFPKNEAVQRRISKLYREVIATVFGDEVSEGLLLQAAKDAHFTFSVLTDRTGIKKHIVDIVEKGGPHNISSHFVPITERDDVDYANLQENEWQVGGELHTESFFTLMEKASDLAQRLIENFDSADFVELTSDKPFG